MTFEKHDISIKDEAKQLPTVNVAVQQATLASDRPLAYCKQTERHSSHEQNVPIVEINVELKASSENLNRTQVFPTPESPINSNLNK